MTPEEAAHAEAIRTLQKQMDSANATLRGVATKGDVQRLEAKVDALAEKALDSAPPWAVREIGWLRMGVGAGVTAVVVAAWDALKRHMGVVG